MIIIRIWHKDLIHYLPNQQLLGQWRECCCIAKNIAEKGTPNHILVNKIMDYPIAHFCTYTQLVIDELESRGYKISDRAINNFEWNIDRICEQQNNYNKNHHGDKFELFKYWHNLEYAEICYWNLREKYLNGGIETAEWLDIDIGYEKYKERCGMRI